MQSSPSKIRSLPRIAAGVALLSMVAACGTVLLNDRGSLTRYDRLKSSDQVASASRIYVDRPALAKARTVRIIPTAFHADVSGAAPLTAAERRLIANACRWAAGPHGEAPVRGHYPGPS